jgi:hypothetical protein
MSLGCTTCSSHGLSLFYPPPAAHVCCSECILLDCAQIRQQGIRTVDHRQGSARRCTAPPSTPTYVHFLQHERASALTLLGVVNLHEVFSQLASGVPASSTPHASAKFALYLPNEDLISAHARTPTEKTPARHDDPHIGVVLVHENPFIMQTRDLMGVED